MRRRSTPNFAPLLLVLAVSCGGSNDAPLAKDYFGDQTSLIQALQETHDGGRLGTTVNVRDLKRAVLTPKSVEALKEILETDSDNYFAWRTAAQLLASQGKPELIDYLLEIADTGYHPTRQAEILGCIPKGEMTGERIEKIAEMAFSHPDGGVRCKAIGILFAKDKERGREAALTLFEDDSFGFQYPALKYLSVKADLDRQAMISVLEGGADRSLCSTIMAKARSEVKPEQWKEMAIALLDNRSEFIKGQGIVALKNSAFVGDWEVLGALRRLSRHKDVYNFGEGGGTVSSLAKQALQFLERSN